MMNKSGKGLCPISLGLAVGLTAGFASLIADYWAGGAVFSDSFRVALIMAAKGFGWGFFIALFYDLISCCCKMKCCRGGTCDCGCKPGECTCGTNKVNRV